MRFLNVKQKYCMLISIIKYITEVIDIYIYIYIYIYYYKQGGSLRSPPAAPDLYFPYVHLATYLCTCYM